MFNFQENSFCPLYSNFYILYSIFFLPAASETDLKISNCLTPSAGRACNHPYISLLLYSSHQDQRTVLC